MAKYAVRLIAPALLGVFILLFPADGLRALGLGEARVDSWLGQRLDVSIRLLEIEPDAVESVSVGPASLEDFERLGVPSDSLGLGLEVTVDRQASPPIVRVRSQRAVNDPVVQFLIDARWANGRVLREYTLFLDPPTVDSPPPVSRVEQEQESRAPSGEAERQPQREQRPAETRTRPASESVDTASDDAGAEPSSAGATSGEGSVPVAAGDTLWSIAYDWRADSNLSMEQVMLAIFNRNREAFLGENINRLRSDVTLGMPELDEVRSVDRAEAERRVREHMRSWQPAAGDDVEVVSDAAMPESRAEPEPEPEPEPADETGSVAEADAGSDSEVESDSGESEPVSRLDVVPPEEDQYAEGSAVSEGEIRAVRDQLAEVEDEIADEGLEREQFDEHIGEIRDALEERDMAGLAVAEESLAELQTRLREAREARAEQERLGEAADDDAAADDDDDAVADYMRELEDEFGDEDDGAADDDRELAAAGDEAADDAGDDAGDGETGADEAGEAADETGASSQAPDDASDESGRQQDESTRPTTATRSTSGGWSAWLWPAIGLLAAIAIVAGALMWWRRRSTDEGEMAGAGFGADDAVDSARAAVARDPADLGARLALLKLLAERGREQEFTDAFDRMYQQVEDESASEWQEALSLAAVHVPDHPLLTPRETSLDESEDLERRADEMFGMLDVEAPDDEGDESATETAPGLGGADDTDDDTFDLDLPEDEPEPEPDRPEREERSDETTPAGESLGEDMDLAVLSERLDDPSTEFDNTESSDRDEDADDFDTFRELEETLEDDADDDAGDEGSGSADAEAPVEIDDDRPGELDLDFEPAREQEAEDVFGESGAREDEDLDLDLSSEVDHVEGAGDDDTLEFTIDDDQPDDGGPRTQGEADESAEASSSLGPEPEPGEPQAPEAADTEAPGDEAPGDSEPAPASLSDEDADVKLDLARAYISVDLSDSARSVLEEVVSDGSEAKRDEAQKLLDDLE